jgi:predicted RNA binding protein YcfA (HicA-like mRNA interferase family)
MKTRSSREITSVLQKKGFILNPDKNSHKFFYLSVNGKKSNISTFLSHGKKDYSNSLLSQVKNQLKFDSTINFENFLDCPFSKEDYLKMLSDKGLL